METPPETPFFGQKQTCWVGCCHAAWLSSLTLGRACARVWRVAAMGVDEAGAPEVNSGTYRAIRVGSARHQHLFNK